ncbi:MAG: hypothetical protein FWG39_03320 [Alphaproteobacteria bacterium]|nr:hypothetical protein [Alphaproteobacteria bacterium]
MLNKKNIIAYVVGLVIGLLIGGGIMGGIAHYQYQKRGEVTFYLDALIDFIDKTPACLEAAEQL